jgi:hypothetical protein
MRQLAKQSTGLDAGLIPITVPELLRLLRDIVTCHPTAPARPGPPAALVGLATPPPASHPPSPPTLERLRRDNALITTNYSCRNCTPNRVPFIAALAFLGRGARLRLS